MNNILIQAKDLTYRYGSLTAVDRVNFEVRAGEIFGFLGPNGAGKTTVVKLLTGLLQPTEGMVEVLGRNMSTSAKSVHAKMGVSFETANLYEQMNAIENLRLFAQLFKISNFDPLQLLERVGLSGRERERVAHYSKGMKQRLMLARALINHPSVLFLDEPTDGLDPVSSQTIHAIIKDSAAQGAAVFLTTHDMVEADKLSDCVAFINHGNIAALNKPSVLKQQYGKRLLKAELESRSGEVSTISIPLDEAQSATQLQELFQNHRIITAHTEEATLEDIFIRLTGRGLTG